MRLSARSYPHPVVGNRDDVPGVGFQSTIEMTADRQNVYLDVTITCSSSTIAELIEDGKAAHAVHVECSNTLYRSLFEFPETVRRLAISADFLNDAVHVNTFVIARYDIRSLRFAGAHSEYGDTSFDINKGEILAVADGYVFDVESNFDTLSRVGSIMHIVPAQADGDQPMNADFNGDKILIVLAKRDFEEYRLIRGHEAVVAPLTCAIVLPILVEALRQLALGDAEDDDDGRRWVRILRRRVAAIDRRLDDSTDCLALAQELLQLPLKRALSAARQLAEGSS